MPASEAERDRVVVDPQFTHAREMAFDSALKPYNTKLHLVIISQCPISAAARYDFSLTGLLHWFVGAELSLD
jgi:hypothetical protein